MNTLNPLPVNIEIKDNYATGNVAPLLNEIRHALNNWLQNHETTVIDLRSIPLAPGEENRIIELLGKGEVEIELNALGPSEITETKYNGVWLVTHYDADAQIAGRFIEITDIPEIVRSQKEDIEHSLQQLVQQLD